MKESRRKKNEKKFGSWKDLLNGGRVYYYELKGRHGWKARYVKEVDVYEVTVRFQQEIYDPYGRLVEIHKKYPVDKGHKQMTGGGGHER